MSQPKPWVNTFHDHLDVCKRCAEQPFNLCPVGAKALKDSVESAQTEAPGEEPSS
jgi:hypothetical protein